MKIMRSKVKAIFLIVAVSYTTSALFASRVGTSDKKIPTIQSITEKKSKKPKKTKTVEYIVEFGDTLYTIAHKHHTTITELCEANGMERSSVIKMGQKLIVPVDTYFPEKKDAKKEPESVNSKNRKRSSPTVKSKSSKKVEKTTNTKKQKTKNKKNDSVDYTVEFGDTLYIIAHKHHTTIKELCEENDIDRNSMIRVGQVLKVPVNTYNPDSANKKGSGSENTKSSKSDKKEKSPGSGSKKEREKKSDTYTVESGDTLFSVARKLRVPLKELMAVNEIGPSGIIKVGQVLKIPKSGYRKPSAEVEIKEKKKKVVAKKKYYTVKKGDTLWKIARRHKLTLSEIRKLNNMKKKDVIHKGMKLVVQKTEYVEKEVKKYYTVKKGDTLWKIARRHKLTLSEIRKLNNIKKKDVIHKGMKLVVGSKKTKIAVNVAGTGEQERKKKGKVAKSKKEKEKRSRIASAKKKSLKKKSKKRNSAMDTLKGKTGDRYTRASRNIIRTAKRYLGKRYVWGAEGPNQFDCSGFTQYVMRKSKGVKIPRISRRQAYYGKYVSRKNLRPGDLIFFDTSRRRRGYVNHVGIYIGNNKFIHASSARHRVVITSLDRPFYKARFKWGRRIN